MTAEQLEAFREAKAICEGLADESRANPFGILTVVSLDLKPEERAVFRRALDLVRSRRDGTASREQVDAIWEVMDAAE
jgi:hypothetical protein